MKYLKITLLLFCFATFITSCSKTSKQGKWIPKEASLIVDINTKSLSSKLSWDEIKQTYWFKEAQNDSSQPEWKGYLDNPEKTGIDVKSDLIIFLLNDNNKQHVVFEGNVKDSKAFEDFSKKIDPSATPVKQGDINILRIKNRAVVGWNNDRFVYVLAAPDMPKRIPFDSTRNPFDSLNGNNNNPAPLIPDAEALIQTCKNIFDLKEENSLYKEERFAKLLDEDGDIHLWENVEQLMKSTMPGGGMMSMLKLDKFIEGNISAATFNFENGKITGKSKMYTGKELGDILKKSDNTNFNTAMVKALPAENIAAVFAWHFRPETLLDMLKLTGLDGFINMFLAQQGVSLDDLIKATKGDIVFSVSNLGFKTDTTTSKDLNGQDLNLNHEKPDASILFSASVADKAAFEKIINVAKKMGSDMSKSANTSYKIDDKIFAFSNSQDILNKYFSGNKTSPAFLDKIKDHPFGGFIDIQMILKSFQSKLTADTAGQTIYNRSLAMWNNIYFTGGEYKDDALQSTMVINLVDQNTNSLKQLNSYINDVSKVAIEEKKKNRARWNNKDSVNFQMPVPPPPSK